MAEAQNICIYMKGDKCALQYCDYYDRGRQKCSLAVESKLKTELLAKKVLEARRKAAEKQKERDIRDYKTRRNIVDASKTMQ